MNKITDWYGSKGLTMGIAADHGGFELKAKLIPFLEGKGFTVKDFGPTVYDAGDDYSVFGSISRQNDLNFVAEFKDASLLDLGALTNDLEAFLDRKIAVFP